MEGAGASAPDQAAAMSDPDSAAKAINSYQPVIRMAAHAFKLETLKTLPMLILQRHTQG